MGMIGAYQIVGKLGQGGMGIVYLCQHPETERKAAVKVLPQQLAGDPVFCQRFKREVQTLQRLDHPGIVKIYDRGVHDGAPWYAMELVEGESLAAILEHREKMPPLRAIAIIRACAEALQHSHALGVVHRDIKPANIMLSADGSIKLMDFGIAKVLDATRMTLTQGVLGTVEYMSPEQSQGRHVDARTDLYSLGAVLYECLTTHVPITGTTPSEVVLKLRTHQVESPDAWVPELPRRLTELVMRLLEKDPLKRPESAQELIRELDRIRLQIESAGPHGAAANISDHVIRGGPRRAYPLLRNPWLYIFVLLIAASLLFFALSGNQPQNDDDDTGNVTQNYRAHVRRMKIVAKRETGRLRFDYALDLCRMLQKHFPDDAKEEKITELIQEIEQAKADHEAKEKLEASQESSPEGNSAPEGKQEPPHNSP